MATKSIDASTGGRDCNGARQLAAQLCGLWQEFSLKGGDDTEVIASVAEPVRKLRRETLASAATASDVERCAASFSTVELCALLEVGEAALRVPHGEGAEIAGHVVALLHFAIVQAVTARGQNFRSSSAAEEPGCAIEFMCDYLDLLLVPLVLRQSSLRRDALQCPCERCLRAVQAVHQLQHNGALRTVMKVAAVPFLFHFLEHTATKVLQRASRSAVEVVDMTSAQRAAEAVAVLGLFARMQDSPQLQVPINAVRALSAILAVESDIDSDGHSVLLGALHVLRNVSGNHPEVLEMTSETIVECGQHLWGALVALPAEELLPAKPRPSAGGGSALGNGAEGSRRRRVGAEDASGNLTATAAESTATASREATGETTLSEPLASPTAPSILAREPECQQFDRNPQDSDECASGAELAPMVPEGRRAVASSDHLVDQGYDESRAQGHGSASGSTGAEDARRAALLRSQVALVKQLGLYSLAMQALFQSDGLSHQRAFSEEAVRSRIVAVMDSLRSAELPQVWQGHLAFQCLRLYLLVCRTSHVQRQYAVLQRSFVERERRTVAFLQSLTPPAQRCCVLLRAVTQDVHSWFLWQMQLPPTPSSTILGASGAADSNTAAASRLLRRPRRPRAAPVAAAAGSGTSTGSGGASGAHANAQLTAASAPEGAGVAAAAAPQSAPAVRSEVGGEAVEQPAPEFDAANQLCLFTKGEAVWLLHAFLLFVIAAVLLAVWRSLEPPRQMRRL